MRVRSGLATRLSSLAALSLILIEKLTPDLVPVQHRIRGIAEPVDGGGEIVEVLEIVLDGEADDVRPAAPELCRGPVQGLHYRVWQSRGDLQGHGGSRIVEVSDINLHHSSRRVNPAGKQDGEIFETSATLTPFGNQIARLRYRAVRERLGNPEFENWNFAHITDLRTQAERDEGE